MMNSILPLKLLFLSTSVGPLGSGMGGGVELTLKNIAQALRDRDHSITIVTPAGSILQGFPVIEIPGRLQSTVQSEGRDAWVALPPESVLVNMWSYARQVQANYDLILNFAYDWLPFYLTPFFQTSIAHLVSMGSLTDATDQIIGQIAADFPGTIALHSHAQAATFEFGDRCRVVGNGFDLSQYQFCAEPDNMLAWVGRLAPEKGLEDAVAAAQTTGIPSKFGACCRMCLTGMTFAISIPMRQ